ncbi:conserved hypothetical protein [Coccidioides posadasii str. Silveira]|uniref:Uncharacterized protein n=1 Tax=Coccidioides posadasii (strain RMSCC 757 / Silveira) TaxID=443226 RepID=E9D9M7_COCPS|nr:conserved hypothetical protein [Coccidioides posadasii str. Silveira]
MKLVSRMVQESLFLICSHIIVQGHDGTMSQNIEGWISMCLSPLPMSGKFDPQPCQPYLKILLGDEYPPSTIYLEYIPNLEMIHLRNCTQKQMDNLVKGIQEMHGARSWIDFDRAETYNHIQLTDEQGHLSDEEEIVLGFGDCLVSALPQTRVILILTLCCSKPVVQSGNSMRHTLFTAPDGNHPVSHVKRKRAVVVSFY